LEVVEQVWPLEALHLLLKEILLQLVLQIIQFHQLVVVEVVEMLMVQDQEDQVVEKEVGDQALVQMVIHLLQIHLKEILEALDGMHLTHLLEEILLVVVVVEQLQLELIQVTLAEQLVELEHQIQY
jgi:hypothetical protein